MAEQGFKFIDRTGAANPDRLTLSRENRQKFIPPVVVKKEMIDAEIERLANLPAPANGRRMSLVAHPETGVGDGLAPGIAVSINVLKPGELLRNIHIRARALHKSFASHRSSLTHLGRSAVFLIGTRSVDDSDLLLTITAATPRPVQIKFDRPPSAAELRHAIDEAVPADGYFDDVHGSPAYRRRLTYYYAEQIRAELEKHGAAA